MSTKPVPRARAAALMAACAWMLLCVSASAPVDAKLKRPAEGRASHGLTPPTAKDQRRRGHRRRSRARMAAAGLTLSPSSGPAGATVKATGWGYPPRSAARLSVSRDVVARFKTSKAGTIDVTFTIPAAPVGATTVSVSAGTVTGTAGFTVLAPPAPAPGPSPVASKAVTTPVGSPILSDADAASRVRRSSWEPRPSNADENRRVPTGEEIAGFRVASGSWGPCAERFRLAVTGNFTGTTDEILQWAAHKWGIDEDIARAQATKESWWYMSTAGDGGVSYGLMQIKSTHHPGTAPLTSISTAFNVDYWGALMRATYEGCTTWLNDVDRGTQYAAGDMWGTVGFWYSGRWHTADAEWYISEVRKHLTQRTWAQRGF